MRVRGRGGSHDKPSQSLLGRTILVTELKYYFMYCLMLPLHQSLHVLSIQFHVSPTISVDGHVTLSQCHNVTES